MRTRLYGLNIDSELTFHESRPSAGEPDVTIRIGEPSTAVDTLPEGRRLLHLELDQQSFTATQNDDGGYLLRFSGTCDFEIDGELRHVTARPANGADPERLAVLAAGTMLSFVLAMRGDAVLHASAAETDDGVVAFVGRSGMGKSTMATLMCADGARLITDDVLRLDLTGEAPRCHLGATELRLRKAAGDLSDRFTAPPPARTTGDARAALRMRPASDDLLPLRAIVIPVPAHGQHLDAPEVTRVPPKDALLYLLQFPRIVGWEDPTVLERQFHETAAVVAAVPVFLARLPWGPPFAPDLAASVRSAIRAQVDSADSTASR